MPAAKKTQEESPEPVVKVKKENRGRFIKYMGYSDIRRLAPGENLLLSVQPLEEHLEWNPQNKHMINTADHKVPDEFWDKLTEFDDFQDVTDEMSDDKKEVPRNMWEKTWSREALQSDRLWTPPPPRA